MKDYTVKQSLLIVAGGGGLLLICLYLFTPLFGSTDGHSTTVTTRLEEAQLANAIAQYAVVFHKYPAGDNAMLTKNLTGDNPQQLTLLNLAASSTNKDGQLIDIWSTPYKFVFHSTNSFIITSAGENRTFGDADDVVFNSATNALPPP